MSQTIKVYVPGYRDESEAVTQKIENILARDYGGATSYRAEFGVWETPEGEIDRNPVNVVESVTPDGVKADELHVQHLAEMVKERLDQEEVLVTITDTFAMRV